MFILLYRFLLCRVNIASTLFAKPPCSSSSIIDGVWSYGNATEETSWRNCPTALQWASGRYEIDYHIKAYNCSGTQAYLSATFQTTPRSDCQLWSFDESVAYISSVFNRTYDLPNIRIFVIGDSVGGQYAIAAKCASESIPSNRYFHVGFLHDHTLRNDVPCVYECIDLEFRTKFHYMCSRCEHGTAKVFDRDAEDFFANRIPAMTNILILTSGIWYNNFKLSEKSRPEELYNKTLINLVPILKNLVRRGVVVVWIALPVTDDCDIAPNHQGRLYGWDTFAEKNKNVETHFTNSGIIIVDANKAIMSRYKKDPKIFKGGGIHYCEPGQSSIPMFVNKLIMQSIASSLYHGTIPFYNIL